MNNPEYAEVNGKQYKINTDFRVAIECNRVAEDETIGEFERALAVIYLLFGKKGLKDYQNHADLLEIALKYLLCGQEKNNDNNIDMDFIQDMDYIETSFMSDYQINLENTKMHWWKFYHLLEGLSNSDFGNCCILNRIRELRNCDVSKIEDKQERDKIINAKKRVALKKKERKLTKKEEESMLAFNKEFGI